MLFAVLEIVSGLVIMTKRLAILGSTGSIGASTMRVLRHLPDKLRVTGLAAGQQVDALTAQAHEFRPKWVHAVRQKALQKAKLPVDCRVLTDEQELCQAVCGDDVDQVLCAISGTGGLRPVLAALAAGKDIALASKEILVMAGNLVTAAAKAGGGRILPVDSEHCAIFQCLEGRPHLSLHRLILTASGGPFRHLPIADFPRVTLSQALAHPTWNMGRKISIDSATMMNKGLEMIEAAWLFGVAEQQLEVVIQPQSIVHSMVEFVDGSILAQMSTPDMAMPIQYCLTYPEKLPGTTPSLDFQQKLQLDFAPPDLERFPALTLARQALRAGQAMGAVFNAANEVAVERFCQQQITFDQIPAIVSQVMQQLQGQTSAASLEDILDADAAARRLASEA